MKRKHTGPGLPKGIVPPAPSGPSKHGRAGIHDSRPRGQRNRAGARRAALSEQGA